jgi:diguanylate cyclase (GGDEF)-like protein
MQYEDLLNLLEHTGKDPARLIFEDELTGISNRRFLRNYLEHKVSWDEADRPLSLLMLDLDGFKEINDTYGHEVGDQALIWVAEQLRDVAGAHGLPIRYAGDEFIILMPHSARPEAVQIAEKLRERVSELTFRGPGGQELELHFSIGIATAPEDAQDGTDLIRRADAALYSAKARGGHCYVVADETNLQQLIEKTGLYQLEGGDIAGRGPQLKQVADALDRFALRESQFLVVTGGPGLGKSTFLETIRQRLEKNSLGTVVSVQARPEELFRPYFLAADILVALMNQRPDRGLSLMEGLSPEQLSYASQILPQLGGDEDLAAKPEQRLRREFIFNTLLLLMFRAVDFRPLIVLIDDLHFTDEATLNLLRVLMSRAEVPLFVCATSTEADQRADDLPLGLFLKAQEADLNIEEIGLTPLSDAEISAHVRAMFPGMRVPEEFETQLCEIIQGNPLFLAEILRKLLMEQKIALLGQEWTVQAMSREELPRSLEEIVSEKIAVLDEEGKQLLAQASVIGENVQLSALAGTSEKMEARVFEFLDQAVRLGLLNSEFEVNDESIHFLSRRVLDIVYGNIQRPRRQELHERAGSFQEELFERKLMPSASVLAYHFGCSGNEEKSRNYVELKTSRDDFVFNAEEALRYSGDELPDCPTLDPRSRAQVPGVLRWMLTAVNNVRLYPAESDAIISATRELQGLLASILSRVEVLDIRRDDTGLLINGEEVELAESELVVEGALNILRRLELRSVAFREGVGEEELGPLLVAFARTRPEEVDQHFWERFLAECGLTHVELRQLRYTKTLGDAAQVVPFSEREAAGPEERVLRAAESTLDSEERADIRELIRCLLGAARGVRLYPIQSQAITAAREQFEEALTTALNVYPVLTLATAGDAVLVNGRRLGGVDVDKLAGDLHEFMTSMRLAGLTFVAPVPESEISGFIAGLRNLSDLATDELFWSRFAEEHGLSQIQVHESLYEVTAAGGLTVKEEVAAEPGPGPEPEPDTEELSPEDLLDFLEALPQRVEECIRSDATQQLSGLVARLFGDFRTRDPSLRESTVVASRTALSKLDAGCQPILAKQLSAPMLDAFDVEDHPDVLRLMAAMLRRMSTVSIQFAEYSLACKLLSKLYPAPQSEQTSLRARMLSQVLKRELEPTTQDLILEDFNSPDPERQQGATRVLGALGSAAESLLVEVIKLTESRRVRQIAANLLSETGGSAGEVLKRAFAFEEMVERRVRILEVLDSVTRDVTSEFACALADKATEVREAALRLAERIGAPEIVEIVLEHARGREAEPAAMAIRCLATLKPRGAMKEVLAVLHSARDAQRVIACCQALGQFGDPSAIQALTKILTPRSSFSLRRGWNSSVRNAAALALAQLDAEEAGEVLARFAKDSDPAVRRIALNARGS